MKRLRPDKQFQDGSYVAEGRGQCGTCLHPIEVGDPFWWTGSTPAQPECRDCREVRLGRARREAVK